jgi:hypothetical protein
MSWETRKGSGRYYTRTERTKNGKYSRQYIGTGPAAELAAALDELLRAERTAHAEARKAEQAKWQGAQRALAAAATITDLLVRAALLASGYHQHARGEWRRRKDGRTNCCEAAEQDADGVAPGTGQQGATG